MFVINLLSPCLSRTPLNIILSWLLLRAQWSRLGINVPCVHGVPCVTYRLPFMRNIIWSDEKLFWDGIRGFRGFEKAEISQGEYGS